MALPRVFLQEALPSGGEPLPISAEDAHHLVDVMRVRVGERMIAVTPDHRAWQVVITDVQRGSGKRPAHLSAADPVGVPTPWSPRVTLYQGLGKGAKVDDVVRDAVELGASAIVPFTSERAIVRLDECRSASRLERWRRIARSAAMQSGAPEIPLVAEVMPLSDLVVHPGSLCLVAWEEASGPTFPCALREHRATGSEDVSVVVGPEGGLTPGEVRSLEQQGAYVCTLGPRILRTETAAVVSLALVIDTLRELHGA